MRKGKTLFEVNKLLSKHRSVFFSKTAKYLNQTNQIRVVKTKHNLENSVEDVDSGTSKQTVGGSPLREKR